MSAQLSAEGAHREAVAKPPALCADGYPDARERDAEHEFVSAIHKSAALQGVQAEGSTFNTGKPVLKEVDARLPRCTKDEILNCLWCDGEIPSIDWVRLRCPSPIVGKV
jgi:hypothetical protein